MLSHRRPLETRSLQHPPPAPTKSNRVLSGAKRARSPDHVENQTRPSPKRVRGLPQDMATRPNKPTKNAEREEERQQKADEFRRKYKKAFPSWTFHFDSESLGPHVEQSFKAKILHLGGKIEIFFSSSNTHLITNKVIPSAKPDKENVKVKHGQALRSPIKLTGRAGDDATCNIVAKAEEYGQKIWNAAKLESVLARILESSPTQIASRSRLITPLAAPKRSLTRLLETEKIHGTTERDPRERRHDYRYFSKGSYFVLLEDIHGQLATLAAHEYPVSKDKDKLAKKPWPVLHCHPLARNPFTPFDEKEKRRYERQQAAEKLEEEEHARRKKQKALLDNFKRKVVEPKPIDFNKGGNNLRKAASVNNIRRRFSHPVAGQHGGLCIDLDDEGDDIETANASGYGASGIGAYVAASGNSVGITSNTGTTSTSMQALRNIPQRPLDRYGRHVVTSLKVQPKVKVESGEPTGSMGPPTKLPIKQHLLKRSKSTNTLKLPKREEGIKPGYCESCRIKFSDFTLHVVSTKHRKFAINVSNFAALDCVLDRLQRQTLEEVQMTEAYRMANWRRECRRNPHMCLDENQEPSSP